MEGDDDLLFMTPIRRRTSTSPGKQKRVSFGPGDVFLSPVQWSEQPSFERDTTDVGRILTKGTTMCRDEISPRYIASMMEDESTAVWLLRDASTRVFGFALTKQHPSFLELSLICSHKRRGEGRKLFRTILEYAHAKDDQLHLEAVNSSVALLYADVARELDVPVFLGDATRELSRSSLEEALRRLDRNISMRVGSPKRISGAPGLSVHAMKAAKRRLYEEDSDDED